MTQPRVRPEFVRILSSPPDLFFGSLALALDDSSSRCRIRLFDGGAILRIRPDERRFWSPALHLHVERCADGRDELHGRFSPSSPVWTAFVAVYIVLACLAVAAACYGGAQMTLEQTPWAFLGVPAALVLAGFTYGAAFIGQGLGSDDMYEMRAVVERVVTDLTASG